MPSSIDVYVAPIETKDWGVGFWGNLFGIDYSAVDKVPNTMRNYDLTGCRFLSPPSKAFTIDLYSKNEPKLSYLGEFTAPEGGVFHGCVMYFEARLSDNVTLSTDPRKPLTHWKHIFLQSAQRVPLKPGEKIKIELKGTMRNTKWVWKYAKP